MNSTPCTDGFYCQVVIHDKNSNVTDSIGLFKVFDFLRQWGGYNILVNNIAPSLPFRKCRGERPQFGNFIQRLAGLLIGKEDLNVDADPSFLATTGLSATSGCASLCTFENFFNEGTLRAMQKSLRELFIHYSPRNPDVSSPKIIRASQKLKGVLQKSLVD